MSIAQLDIMPIIESQMKTLQSKFKSASIAIALVIVACFLFELPNLEPGILFPINGDALTKMGANFGPLTILKNEYWRLLSFGFLHSNLIHLLLNVWALLECGSLAETTLGKKTYLFIYFISGIAGGLASILFDPLRTSVGASASICGVLGAFIYVSWFSHELKRSKLLLLLIFLAYSLILGSQSNSMDNAAHIGGFFAGILAAALLKVHKAIACLTLIAVCIALTFIDVKRLDKNPTVDEFLLRQEGAKFAQNDQFLPAVDKFNQALTIIANEPFALQGRGEALMKMEKYEEAKKDFDTILLKDPKHKGALFDRSIVLMHLGRYQEGLVDVDNLVSVDAGHSMVYNNRAWFRLNDFNNPESLKLALKDVQKATELDKQNLAAYDTRGTIYLMMGEYDKAQAEFEKCLKIKETSAAANFHLAILELAKGNKETANKRLEEYRASDYKPDEFELRFCKEKFGLSGLDQKSKTQ